MATVPLGEGKVSCLTIISLLWSQRANMQRCKQRDIPLSKKNSFGGKKQQQKSRIVGHLHLRDSQKRNHFPSGKHSVCSLYSMGTSKTVCETAIPQLFSPPLFKLQHRTIWREDGLSVDFYRKHEESSLMKN